MEHPFPGEVVTALGGEAAPLAEGLSLTIPVLLWPKEGKTKYKPSHHVKDTGVGKK